MWRWPLLILLLLPPLACSAGWVRSEFAQDLVQVYRNRGGTVAASSRIYSVRSDAGVLALEIDHIYGSRFVDPPVLDWYFHAGMPVMNNYGDAGSRRWGLPV